MLYGLVLRLLLPAAWWVRLHVDGAEAVPSRGPLLLVPNHDSQQDPVLVGLALRRRRPRFLARANPWKVPGLGPILYGLGQIPIERGAGDSRALAEAIDALRRGEAICVFPEGRLSGGERVGARSGVARLASWCPGVTVVLCAVEGATDYVRFPRRPRVTVTSSLPEPGSHGPRSSRPSWPTACWTRFARGVPPVPAGRRHREAAASVG